MNLKINYMIAKQYKSECKGIFLDIRYKNKRFYLHTGECIEVKHWDSAKQRAKRRYALATELNAKLEKYKIDIEKLILTFKTENPFITFAELKQKLLNKVKNRDEFNFYSIFENYKNSIKAKHSKNYYNSVNSLQKNMQAFEKLSGIKFELNAIDLQLLDKIQNYLLNDKELSTNYVNKTMELFKRFLNWACEMEYTENTKFKKHRNLKQENIKYYTFTDDELQVFKKVVLNDKLDKSRDIFLFQLYTGQRIGDVLNFKLSDVKNNVWELKQGKTNANVRIPITKPIMDILAKYDYSLPIKAEQKINNDIKEIGKLAGIKRYAEITTHTARRTFVTILSNNKYSQQVIKQFTGQSSDKMISLYYNNTDDNLLMQVSNAMFSN